LARCSWGSQALPAPAHDGLLTPSLDLSVWDAVPRLAQPRLWPSPGPRLWAQAPAERAGLAAAGEMPSPRMYATAAARSDGLLLLCGGRDAGGTPLADAYGFARHRDGRWEWHLAPGSMPTGRYQHGAVFVGARLHISGGAVGGGRMVSRPRCQAAPRQLELGGLGLRPTLLPAPGSWSALPGPSPAVPCCWKVPLGSQQALPSFAQPDTLCHATSTCLACRWRRAPAAWCWTRTAASGSPPPARQAVSAPAGRGQPQRLQGPRTQQRALQTRAGKDACVCERGGRRSTGGCLGTCW
jgi:hypothetical protein